MLLSNPTSNKKKSMMKRKIARKANRVTEVISWAKTEVTTLSPTTWLSFSSFKFAIKTQSQGGSRTRYPR